jgi:cellulose synthase (UDP-forming)
MDIRTDIRTAFLKTASPRGFLLLNAALAIAYFVLLAFFFPIGNRILFYLLIAGEIFHVWQVLTFIYTVYRTDYEAPRDASFRPEVDIFITVAGEPRLIVEETARAARAMRYGATKHIYLLNDGLVVRKENWRDMEELARHLGIGCITRTVPGGAKAGNINNALLLTKSPVVVIFDADHVPHEDFLEKTIPYFSDRQVGFVQTPQFYKNFGRNYITHSSWEQQELFFGPICKGKNRLNAATMCGTNMAIRRSAIESVGGMCTDSIAEDFVTGMFIHENGWRSVYVPEVLAEGLATEDMLSYSKQQFRWARGALDLIFSYNPLLRRGLTWPQRIQYLSSASFYLSGVFVAIDALLPLIFFFTGQVPVVISGMLLAAVFLPYMFVTIALIQKVSNNTFTFSSLAFSMSAFHIHVRALISAAMRTKAAFEITPKAMQQGNFTKLVTPHFIYIGLTVVGIGFAYLREGFSASLINNTAWALVNIAVMYPFIRAAMPKKTEVRKLRVARA